MSDEDSMFAYIGEAFAQLSQVLGNSMSTAQPWEREHAVMSLRRAGDAIARAAEYAQKLVPPKPEDAP